MSLSPISFTEHRFNLKVSAFTSGYHYLIQEPSVGRGCMSAGTRHPFLVHQSLVWWPYGPLSLPVVATCCGASIPRSGNLPKAPHSPHRWSSWRWHHSGIHSLSFNCLDQVNCQLGTRLVPDPNGQWLCLGQPSVKKCSLLLGIPKNIRNLRKFISCSS
jgi:hypothetical protein